MIKTFRCRETERLETERLETERLETERLETERLFNDLRSRRFKNIERVAIAIIKSRCQ